MAVAHFPLNFGARHKSRHRVDDDHVNRAGAHKRLGNFQRLLAGVRLGNQQGIHIHAKGAGVDGVKRVFHVDKRGVAAVFLPLRNTVEGKRGFSGAFRPVNLGDTAARKAADAKRQIQ